MWFEGELHVHGSERGSGLSHSCFPIFVVGDAVLPLGGGWAPGLLPSCSPGEARERPAGLRLLLAGKQAVGFLGHRHSVVYGTKFVV